MEWDHVIPLARGGLDLPCNMLTACRRCNREKRDYLPSEAFDRVPRAVLAIEAALLADWSARQEAAAPKIDWSVIRATKTVRGIAKAKPR